MDLYDRVDLIPFDKLTAFFQNNLNPQGVTVCRAQGLGIKWSQVQGDGEGGFDAHGSVNGFVNETVRNRADRIDTASHRTQERSRTAR